MENPISLILASSTFNNTDQLKLLGFTSLKHVLIDRRCSLLVRAFLYDCKIETTEIDIKKELPSVSDIYLFHDNHGDTQALFTIANSLKNKGAQLYIFESPLIDVRSGFRPY
jgi:hypothetical protein